MAYRSKRSRSNRGRTRRSYNSRPRRTRARASRRVRSGGRQVVRIELVQPGQNLGDPRLVRDPSSGEVNFVRQRAAPRQAKF